MNTKRFYLRIVAVLFAGLFVFAMAYLGWAKWKRYQWELNGDEPPLVFLEAVKPVPKFRIFEGFERFVVMDQSPEEVKQIIEAKKRAMQLCQFPFHSETVELSEADAKTFLELVLNRGTYAQHLNPSGYYGRECGGFNPDAIAEWEVNGKQYHLLICLGCGELQTNIEGQVHSKHYMRERSHQEFRKLLTPYFKHHNQDTKKRWKPQVNST